MQLNNPIFINQTDADIRYINATGDALNGTLSVTGLTVSGLGTPFILKSASNGNSVYFDPTTNGNAGALFSNYVYSSNMGSRGDDNFSLSYGGGGTRSLIFRRGVDRALLDSNGNFGIGSGISSVPSRFYVSGNTILQGDLNVTGNILLSGNPVLTGVDLSAYATTANLALTGSTLQTNINDLSNTYATITNVALTGSTLDTKINNLSGYINSSSSNLVFTTGNQTIAGNKNFTGDINLTGNNNRIGKSHYIDVDSSFVKIKLENGTPVFDSEELSLYDINGASSVTFSSRELYATNYISIDWDERYLANQNGIPVLTWTGNNIGIGTNTPTEKLQVDGNIRLNQGGLYIYDGANGSDNKITWQDNELLFQNDFDYSNKQAGFLFGSGPLGENVLYSFMGGSQNTNLSIPSGKTDYIAVDSEVVHKIGNETISGVKAFDSRPTVNGTGVLLSGEAAPKDIATTINISSNTISLDLSAFSYFLINLNNNITTTNFNNPKVAPEVTNFVLQLSGDGTIRSVTWPTSLRWPGSTAPTITIGPNKVDTYSIFSYDGGISYYGFPAGYNS